MNGHELARAIRQSALVPPLVVAVTGWGTEAGRPDAREAGFDAHLTKPADPLQIVEQSTQRLAHEQAVAAAHHQKRH